MAIIMRRLMHVVVIHAQAPLPQEAAVMPTHVVQPELPELPSFTKVIAAKYKDQSAR